MTRGEAKRKKPRPKTLKPRPLRRVWKPAGAQPPASAQALVEALFGKDPDPEGTLLRQAGWAGVDGDVVWIRRLADEARRAGYAPEKVWAAYESGQAGEVKL